MSKEENMNALEQIIRQIRNSEKTAERTWTYREVCAQLLDVLKEITGSSNSVEDAEAARIRLVNFLRVARASLERDTSLIGVVNSVERLIMRIDACEDLTASAVQDAVEVVVLEIGFTVSQHR
jgi:hypothetical protein